MIIDFSYIVVIINCVRTVSQTDHYQFFLILEVIISPEGIVILTA